MVGFIMMSTLNLLLLLSLIPQSVGQSGKAVVKIKLKKFDSKGDDSNGERCDPTWWPNGEERCDPEFIFCVDKYSGNNDVDSCKYYRKKTSHYDNKDQVNFGSNIKGMPNPIEKTVTDYEGIRFKVYVEDVDDINDDDKIDKFDWKYRPIPDRNEAEAERKERKIRGNRSGQESVLEFYIWVYCDENSYGDDCSVFCKSVDEDGVGHVGCHPDTGEEYCLDGWEDLETNCLIPLDNCSPFSCANGGVCVDEYNGFSCRCRPGYSGEWCELNINECSSSPCLNGGTCIDGVNGYTCDCPPFYTGSQCRHHVCDHPSAFCHNGGTCYEQDYGTVGCMCPQQYTGLHCDVDACQILNCAHGECRNGVCDCEPHFIGGLCDVRECEQTPCQSGGTCLDNGKCACSHGHTGQFCENAVLPCESQPCMNNAECVDLRNGEEYECRCQAGYTGALCEHAMSPCDYPVTYCLNGGTCYAQNDTSVSCACPQQYAGDRCDVDACEVLDCAHGQCQQGICVCERHFSGELCDVKECEQFPCQFGGTCLDSGQCLCQSGSTGRFCEQRISPCESQPCMNSADCVQISNAAAFECRCQPGYYGTFCESHYSLCSQRNADCLNGGTCYERGYGTIGCLCPPLYTGSSCETHICQVLNCGHGECRNGACECHSNFIGPHCDIRECEQFPCQTGGTCLTIGRCRCQFGFTGRFCEHAIPPCESNPCMNNAECISVTNSREFSCRCPPGFNGTLCEKKNLPISKHEHQVGNKEQNEEDNSDIPVWALGLILAIVVLCAIIVVAVLLLLKYRRKYKRSVENPQTQPSGSFSSPFVSETEQSLPAVTYTAKTNIATVSTKMPPCDCGHPEVIAPPPYTPYPEGTSNVPLPFYEESREAGAVGFVNQAFNMLVSNKTDSDDTNEDTNGSPDKLVLDSSGGTPAFAACDNPLYATLQEVPNNDAVSENQPKEPTDCAHTATPHPPQTSGPDKPTDASRMVDNSASKSEAMQSAAIMQTACEPRALRIEQTSGCITVDADGLESGNVNVNVTCESASCETENEQNAAWEGSKL